MTEWVNEYTNELMNTQMNAVRNKQTNECAYRIRTDCLLYHANTNSKYTSKFLLLAMLISYYTVPLWLLQVGVPLTVLWRYSDATVIGANVHQVAAEYPHSTLNGIPTCSSHSGTALYETHLASQEECVHMMRPSRISCVSKSTLSHSLICSTL